MRLIIFTDLDGTLLDHHSYSWEAALPAIESIRQRKIPLILTTSKTAAETAELHRELKLDTPYIVENGAGIILPRSDADNSKNAYFFGKPYEKLISLVQQLRQEKAYRFRGFNDLTLAGVISVTGLPEHQAKLARKRLYSEPLCWDDSEKALQGFAEDLKRHNLKLLRGGRFYHVLSAAADKGAALRWVMGYYQQQQPQTTWHSIALGDGPNDKALLEAADLAVVIPSISGLSPDPEGVETEHARFQGPQGWNQVILDILERYPNEGAEHG